MVEKITDELMNVIKKGEGVTTEFKKASNRLPQNLFETICAFLNRNGGNIFLGIADDGKIMGVNKESIIDMKKDFANLCNNPEKIEPTIYLNIKEYEINDKVILHIYVNEGTDVYRTNGKVFDRNEDGDYEMKYAGRIANIYLRKQYAFTEDKVYPHIGMEDLREDLIKRARQMAINRNGEEHVWANLSNEEILRSAKLFGKDVETGKEGLTLAAILLFGKDDTILSALPFHRTDAIYRVRNLDRYDDRDDIRTNLIESFDRLMAFIRKHLDDRFYLEGVQRIDVRNKIAREVCVNLLMHREFSSTYIPKLIIERDCFRTENANITKKIGKINLNSYEPYSKNPKIAKVFRTIGFADELGSGVKNMYKYTKIYSGGEPELKEDDIFTAYIPIIDITEQQYLTKSIDQVVTKSNDKDKILEFCQEPRKLSEIMKIMNYKHKSNFKKKYINPLLDENKLQMTVPDKPNSQNQKYIANKK